CLFCHALLCVFNLCHDYSSPLGGGQVYFGGNFVWGIDSRLEEYPDIMIYKWIIIGNHIKNKQLLQINRLLY
ncbi:hypothetical protein, partial [Blautia wexlerae]|uniref:hypothetical protein n=1 Tax=Blautia wexlerae TaxID=418240 RepID=UPI001C031204